MMKNIILKLMLVLSIAVIGLDSCDGKDPVTDPTDAPEVPVTPPADEPEDNPQEPETPPAEEPEDDPQEPETPPADEPDNSIRILAIGNSFSVDAMQYLYGILEDIGYEDITLGNLYIGGCTLETHSKNFTNNSASYTYYTNTTGSWNEVSSYKPHDALKSEEWDLITMQQGSPVSGVPSSYDPYLASLVASVRTYCADAELAWHMTWAYQASSTHSGFANYGKDQMTMYNAIANAVQTKVVPTGWFVTVIPNGTAVQNLRTSFIGDNLTRDGYHMSYDKGRYLTALTFAQAITGRSIADVSYIPAGYTITEKEAIAMKEAVANACKTPYAVTESSYPPDPNFNMATATPKEILEYNGFNSEDYTQMQIEFTDFAYYNSSNSTYKSKMYTVENSGWGTTICDFVTTAIYTKDDLPNGTIIIQRTGNMYRPEGWTALNVANTSSTRPGNVTSNLVKVDDAWWSSWNYRAFNLAFADRTDLGPNPLQNPNADNLCGKLKEGFAIFIPKK